MLKNIIVGLKDLFKELWFLIWQIDYKNNEKCENAILSSILKEKKEIDVFNIHSECRVRNYKLLTFGIILPILLFIVPLFISIDLLLSQPKHLQWFHIIGIIIVNLFIFLYFNQIFFIKTFDSLQKLMYCEKKLVDVKIKKLEETKKGQVIMLLFDQLINKELGLPNWLNLSKPDTKIILEDLYNIDSKNLFNKAKYFQSRSKIIINTDKTKTTYKGYLSSLITIYKETNDKDKIQIAKSLKDYINSLPEIK